MKKDFQTKFHTEIGKVSHFFTLMVSNKQKLSQLPSEATYLEHTVQMCVL